MVASDQDPRIEFQVLCDALRNDDARNQMICADVVSALNEGRSPLVLTERVEHLEQLAQRLTTWVPDLIVLHGGVGQKALRDIRARLAELSSNARRLILATGRYVGEGFDDPRLDTLFLTLPVSWRGTIAQYAGRLHRLQDGKREVRVYDYADLNVPMLSRMFERRCHGYEALGYTLMLPASALPGWPVDVPLPVDPLWKKDYAGSVRRLVRDGVDTPLAKLFVHVTRPFNPDAQGATRARSASEAFFYRRLGTLPETSQWFQLNAELPIAFDGWGNMEVDLLCADARLVIELDGAQHLADPEAYRRDRRKDALLQQNGYFVLRFLAEDLGKRLDYVLDTVLGALVNRQACRRSFV
jgi:very-short-patch-repair endonuclease